MNSLSIITPDDWHLHLRDTPYLEAVVADTARQFGRAIIMPNLNPPVRGCEDALAYRERIMAALPPGCDFEPLMTLYLTDNTRVEDIEAASEVLDRDVLERTYGGQIVEIPGHPGEGVLPPHHHYHG